jgi:hypothetical protein
MWLVDPKIMCRQHLLGEHVELHMLVGTIRHGISIDGYVDAGLVETHNIAKRHEQLVEEMERRGYNHKSELAYSDTLHRGRVPRRASRAELLRRCPNCRQLEEDLRGHPSR